MTMSIADQLRDLADKLDEDVEEELNDYDKTIAAFSWLAEVDIEIFDGVFYRDNDATILLVVSRLLQFTLNDTSKRDEGALMDEGFMRAFEWLLPEMHDPRDEALWRKRAFERGEGEAYMRHRAENQQYERQRLEERLAHVDAFAETVKNVARSLRSVRRNRCRRGLL